jgi:glycosyltransferase involved in cell wall biosynthesis
MRGGIDASVVIPTRDRPDDLERCLAALERQETRRSFEIVVVDDGSEPPLEHVEQEHPHVRVVRVDGVGPGPARNAGVAAARGPVVAFTDDDTEPAPTWLESAAASLERRPDLVGVEGPIESPPYDYLSELSLENESPGAFWTCNVAYRADALRRLGGFSSEFPYPHCEDRDLGYRALDLGPIGWADEMRVLHHPRPLPLRANAARMRFTQSEILLFARHRDRIGGRLKRLPPRLYPIVHVVLLWGRRARQEGRTLLAHPRRLGRFVVVGVVQIALIAYYALQGGAPPRRRYS